MYRLLVFLSVSLTVAMGQQVNVTIFTESQCPYCTKLMREQLWPFYITQPGIMNLQMKNLIEEMKGKMTLGSYDVRANEGRTKHPTLTSIIPFGKGDCQYDYNRNFACTCMHGPTECDLNRLQNCAISYFPRRHLGLVTCIQGLGTLREAFSRCLSRLSPRTQQKLIECSTTQTGELLNYYSMVNTHRTGVKIWPTAYVNGVFFDRSYPMAQKICENTDYC